ncbi:zinc finger protein 287-like isoform X1 [Salvelinus fontinalis]|uniref:zinc finger protein 287-like isoform X1 n=1 Tax=Salvelinus fontinalis TaxID=8038 RepID=UPI002484E766|nr:zinc finger protein 287-like isoform X1 [Salvelinus fontinalis]
MSFELAFRSRVAFIMETLTATALQDICQFMELTYAALRVEILQEQNRSSTTKLHAMENSEGKEKPANNMESVREDARSSGFRNFPVVEQILNEQEANGLWLEGDPTVEDEGPPSLLPEEEQPSQAFGQMTDKGVETCSAPLVIKQEETDDDVMESQGYSVWMPETHKTNQNITGESDEYERSQASRGSKELGLDDFKKEQSLLLVSIEDAAAPTKKKKYNIRYTCKICGKTGTKKGRMTSHLITHEGPSSCDICDEKFKHQNGLNKHKLLKHSVKPYSCFVCGKMFLYSKIRDYHERIHVGEDYWCADCGKTFKERQDRDTHECIVCKGDRPYSCSECNKDFERQYHLKQHQLEKHPLMVEQTVEPEPESKHFEDQQRQFESAESSEAPIRSEPIQYTCEICGTTWATQNSMRSHMFIHRKIQRRKHYTCDVCGKVFRLKSPFTKHQLRHKGDLPFSCSECNQDFKSQYHLKKHQLQKHPLKVEQPCSDHDLLLTAT